MTATYRNTLVTATNRNSNIAVLAVSDTDVVGDVGTEQVWCGMVRSKPQHGEGRPMAGDAAERTRLAAEMDRRRIALGLRWEHIADKARISTTHLRKYRRGDAGASDVVIAGLEDALQWQRGSIAAILQGGQPTPTADSPHRDADKTLGELLLERGLARPEDLDIGDEVRNDPVAWEIIGLVEISEDARNQMLQAYANMRRVTFRAALSQKKRPRV